MNKQIDPFEIDSMILQEIVHDIVSEMYRMKINNFPMGILDICEGIQHMCSCFR